MQVPAELAAHGVLAVVAYALPLSRRFRGTTLREGLLLQGPAGWGEWAPFPEYDDEVAARWLAAGVEAATAGFPPPRRATVAVNAIVPALAPEAAAAVARAGYEESGCTTVKVKVAERGESLEADLARVHAVRAALPATARVRVDANGGWSLAQAREALVRMGELEYVEQPCAELSDCRAVRDLVPVALDESVRRGGHDLAALRDAADVVVLKAAPLGGVRAALALADRLALPVAVSGALDSAVGLSAGLALAAALPEQQYAAGLGTGRLLGHDVTAAPVVPRDGALPVRHHAPDPAALGAVAQSTRRSRWWAARLQRAAALLRSGMMAP